MSSNWPQTSRPWANKGSWSRPARQRQDSVASTAPPPFGDVLRTLQIDDLGDRARDFAASAKILDVRTVTSYNWMDKCSEPTILVPGKPPLWTPQTVPSRLREDSGSYFRDKNAARYPKHPMEPAVIASLDADPTIPSQVDVVACGSTLGNLLRFVRGEDRPFRMLAYKVRDTLFLVRRENSPTELISDIRGFGHSFPEANTTWEREVKGSASHQRVVRYSFGEMELLVRLEADGYIRDKNAAVASNCTGNSSTIPPSVDDLASSFHANTTISPQPSSPPPAERGAALKIVPSHNPLTPHSALFDLKTRSIRTLHKDHLAEQLPRLWITQIPTLILAFHTNGLFERKNTEIKDAREEVRKWEEGHAAKLAKLAALLSWIQEVVVEGDEAGGKVEICHREGGKLEVRRQLPDAGEVLSAGVRRRWEEEGGIGALEKDDAAGEEGGE